jgi:hypothetical protein
VPKNHRCDLLLGLSLHAGLGLVEGTANGNAASTAKDRDMDGARCVRKRQLAPEKEGAARW